MAHEVELKFDVEPGGVALIRGATVLAAASPEEQAHDTLYFDTRDGALRRAGFSLRVRRSGDRFVQIGPWRFRERAARDLSPLAQHELDRQWRKVRRHSMKLGKLDAKARHQLRIEVKKLRYTAEFLAGLWAKKPKLAQRDRFIAALKALQDRLGDLNDAEAAEAITARLAPGLRGSADRIRRRALAGEGIAAAKEAFAQASSTAGYWL